MPPNGVQHQSSSPVALPAVPALATAPAAPVGPATTAAPQQNPQTLLAAEHTAEVAKQLVLQYQHDPFQLAQELARLKAAYLAQQYQIVANQAGH